jgi:hypothetical protein
LRRLTVLAVVAVCLASCGGLKSAASASPGSASGTIIVTTPAHCQTGSGAGEITWFPLGNADSGHSYRIVPCQAVGVELLHSASDGCGWTSVHTADPGVMAILPIPLPLPPQGATDEVYRAVSPGFTTVSSSLSCPDGSVEQSWSVTIDVVAAAPVSS